VPTASSIDKERQQALHDFHTWLHIQTAEVAALLGLRRGEDPAAHAPIQVPPDQAVRAFVTLQPRYAAHAAYLLSRSEQLASHCFALSQQAWATTCAQLASAPLTPESPRRRLGSNRPAQ
jgi:hypothetical protein